MHLGFPSLVGLGMIAVATSLLQAPTLLELLSWTDLADTVIDENFDKLPLLTPEAFSY